MFEQAEIETGLVHQEIEKIEQCVWNNRHLFSNSTFETGYLGASTFYCYLWLHTGERDYLQKAENFLEKGLSLLDATKFRRLHKTDSLDNHIAQAGRFLEFLKANDLMNIDTDEITGSLDGVLFELMSSKISIKDFDIQSGALAAGYYFLCRTSNRDEVEQYLSVLLKGLEEKAEIDNFGNFSWVSPALYNRTYLGISHGSSLIISFVCNAYEQGIDKDRCEKILNKAAAFLLRYQSDFGRGLFPNFVEDNDFGPKQFSLCYGDIGNGYALLRMGSLLSDANILSAAKTILDDCTKRKKEDNLTLDASLTYGASGLAAAFEKIHSITSNDNYLQAANYWYAKIPEYAIHQNQFAGYRSRISEEKNAIWDLCFAWGITGIGTSFLKYINPDLPSLAPLLLIA